MIMILSRFKEERLLAHRCQICAIWMMIIDLYIHQIQAIHNLKDSKDKLVEMYKKIENKNLKFQKNSCRNLTSSELLILSRIQKIFK